MLEEKKRGTPAEQLLGRGHLVHYVKEEEFDDLRVLSEETWEESVEPSMVIFMSALLADTERPSHLTFPSASCRGLLEQRSFGKRNW